MVWKNRGHEYDKQFLKYCGQDVYLWGAGVIGARILDTLNYNSHIKGIIDSNKKNKEPYYGIELYSPEEFFAKANHTESIILICFEGSSSEYEQIINKCGEHGYTLDDNVFIANYDFQKYTLPIICAYIMNKTFFFAVGINVTEKCTLKCKECTMSIPYVDNPVDESFAQLKDDIDGLFNRVDYVMYLQLLGGEPFLNRDLGKIIKYIWDNYSDRIHRIVVYTNGSILPHEKDFEILRDCCVVLRVSDYTHISKEIKKMTEKFIGKMEKEKIELEIIQSEFWTPYGFRDVEKKMNDYEERISFFNKCKPGCWTVHRGKLYYCYAGKMAENISDKYKGKSSYLQLQNNYSSKELVEWYNGYTEKGYMEICKYCNGDLSVNNQRIGVAEQV